MSAALPAIHEGRARRPSLSRSYPDRPVEEVLRGGVPRRAEDLTQAAAGTFTSPRACSTSAICTALVAAPLSRLSLTTHICRPRGWLGSRRRRPTNTSSRPALESAVG